MGKGAAVVVALLGLAAWASPSPEGEGAQFYVAPPLQDIVSGEVPKGASLSAELVAARGETEAFFVVLRGKAAAAGAKLEAAPTTLTAQDAQLDPSRVRVFRALWTEVDGRRIPDALVPLHSNLEVIGASRSNAGEDVPLYVEVSIPQGTAPGTYRGALKIITGTGALDIPVSVRVLKAQLPARASLPTAFDFSSREAALGSGAKLDGAGLSKLVESYATAALASRITLIGGTGAAPDYASTPGENGLQLDFKAFDAEMAALMDGVSSLDGAAQTAITLRVPGALKGIARMKYVLAFEKHLEEKGWADRLIAFGDHPALEGELVPQSLLSRRVEECALHECASGKVSGKRWWSIGDGSDGVTLRLGTKVSAIRSIGWLAFGGGAQGLRYGNTVGGFGDAMWNGATANGALFYPVKQRPGVKATVVESLRLKALRDGLEDYELLKLARESGHANLTGEVITRIAGSPDAISHEPSAWLDARAVLADAAENPMIAQLPKARRGRGSSRSPSAVPADRACLEKSDGTTTGCPAIRQ